MYSFKNDYSDIAHQDVLNLLCKCSNEQNLGYGYDIHTEKAKKLIKNHLSRDVEIYFLVGGTITNKIVLSHLLKPYEAVISATSGHINVHETGAIEQTGHKIISTRTVDGKINRDSVLEILKQHTDEHMVMPRVVYISNTTEIGTLYSKSELKDLRQVCDENGLYLYLDGARLGSALTSEKNDLTLDDIANLTDVFYIGGTKNGAMFGEAVVFSNKNLSHNFKYQIKNQGGLLAKGFNCALQFEALFSNHLFFKIGKLGNDNALKLYKGLRELGVEMLYQCYSNQLFVVLSNPTIKNLKQEFLFEEWEKIEDDKSVVRLVTSWITSEESIDYLLKRIKDNINARTIE